jgi:hypothetical protein
MGDWLGTGTVAPQLHQYRSFKKARAFARSLGLKSGDEWSVYCKSEKKPRDIPAQPVDVYAKAGWSGMSDWLGTGRRPPAAYVRRRGGWRAFKKARSFVRRLGLKSTDEWYDYCKSGKMPTDIPRSPEYVYAEAGWTGMGDWLGNTDVVRSQRQYRLFNEARAFARSLGLKSGDEWREYCRSSKRPADIPVKPSRAYAEAGWAGMSDWLGTGKVRRGGWRAFKKTRAFVHSLNLKSEGEWRDYCTSGRKPDDIPASAGRTYANNGWAGMGDWLGTGTVAAPRRRESEARTVV